MPPKKKKPIKRKAPKKTKAKKPAKRKASKAKAKKTTKRRAPQKQKPHVTTVPVSSTNRGRCELKWKAYKSDSQVPFGHGQSAHVFRLCDEKKTCPYVLRMEPFLDKSWKDEFLHHAKLAELAGKHAIGPKVHDWWICQNKEIESGMIVADRWDADLNSIFESGTVQTQDQLNSLIQQLQTLLDKWHKLGYSHGDINANNFLYRRSRNKIDVCLIDFQLSVPLTKEGYEKDERMFQQNVVDQLQFRFDHPQE